MKRILTTRPLRAAVATLFAGSMLATGVIDAGAALARPQAGATARTASVDLVNPLMGTDSSYELSYGNTYPAVAVPFGMNAGRR